MTPTPDTNPVDELLAAESDRDKRARELGTALTALLEDFDSYRKAWKQALAAGFARTDLLRVGFIDPAKLPAPGAPPPPPLRERHQQQPAHALSRTTAKQEGKGTRT